MPKNTRTRKKTKKKTPAARQRAKSLEHAHLHHITPSQPDARGRRRDKLEEIETRRENQIRWEPTQSEKLDRAARGEQPYVVHVTGEAGDPPERMGTLEGVWAASMEEAAALISHLMRESDTGPRWRSVKIVSIRQQ